MQNYLSLMVLSVISSHLFFFKYAEYQIQLTEILFCLSCFAVLHFQRSFITRSYNSVYLPFFILMIIAIINSIHFMEFNVILRNLGLVYLSFLVPVISIIGIHTGKENFEKSIKVAGHFGFWILNLLAVLGIALYLGFDYSKLVLVYKNYPYFGDVFRIKGLNYSPNIFISVYAFFIVMKSTFDSLKWYDILIAFFITIASLTKEGLLLAILISAISYNKGIEGKRFFTVLFIGGGILYMLLSQFVVIHSGLTSTSYAVNSDVTIYIWDKFKVHPTVYYYLFKSGIWIFIHNPLAGVGNGNFVMELNHLVNSGFYPPQMPRVTPMDSYFGIAAQLGSLFLVYLFSLFQKIVRILKYLTQNYTFLPLYYLGLYFMTESLSNGSFYYRHYYVYFAIIIALYCMQEYSMEKN